MIEDDDRRLSERLTHRQALGHFRRVLEHASGYRRVLLLCLLGSLLSAVAEVELPRLMAEGIDQFMLAPGSDALAGLQGKGLTYLALVLTAAALSYSVTVGFNRLGQTVVEILRNRLFEHLQRLPVSYFDKNPVGRLVTRVVYDTGTLSDFFTGILSNFLGDVLKLLVLTAALVYSSGQLALTLWILLPPLLWAALVFQRGNTRINRVLRRQLAQLSGFLQENLQGLTTLKAFTAEAAMQEEFDRHNGAYFAAEMQILRLYTLFRPLFGSVATLAQALVLDVGAYQVAHHQITLGTLVLFLFYLKMFFAPLDDLAERFNVLQSAAVSAERIFDILDFPAEPGQTGRALERCQGLIEFEDVHFAYDPAKSVLQGVSFRLEPGQKLALVGATGSGKTTITALLQRMYDLRAGGSGRIRLDGVNIEDYAVDALRRQFGVIQQELFLFKASLRENISLYRDASLEEALRISRAEQVVAAHPEGLARVLGERGHQLSQGERQLVSFARALAGNPPVLIFDEATASIDSLTEDAIQRALEEVLKGRTAIVVAHRLSTIQSCDQILVLDAGKIIERGTHRELMEQKGVYAEMVRTQLPVEQGPGDRVP